MDMYGLGLGVTNNVSDFVPVEAAAGIGFISPNSLSSLSSYFCRTLQSVGAASDSSSTDSVFQQRSCCSSAELSRPATDEFREGDETF